MQAIVSPRSPSHGTRMQRSCSRRRAGHRSRSERRQPCKDVTSSPPYSPGAVLRCPCRQRSSRCRPSSPAPTRSQAGRSGRHRVRDVHDRHDRLHHDLGRHGRRISTPVVAAHIHPGAAGVSRCAAHRLLGGDSSADRCTERGSWRRSSRTRQRFYYNVHTDLFRSGAIRGQLDFVAASPRPGSAGLMILGLIGVAWLRRRSLILTAPRRRGPGRPLMQSRGRRDGGPAPR